MIHQTRLPEIKAIKELDNDTRTMTTPENGTEEPKIERRLGKDLCACPACDKSKGIVPEDDLTDENNSLVAE